MVKLSSAHDNLYNKHFILIHSIIIIAFMLLVVDEQV